MSAGDLESGSRCGVACSVEEGGGEPNATMMARTIKTANVKASSVA